MEKKKPVPPKKAVPPAKGKGGASTKQTEARDKFKEMIAKKKEAAAKKKKWRSCCDILTAEQFRSKGNSRNPFHVTNAVFPKER